MMHNLITQQGQYDGQSLTKKNKKQNAPYKANNYQILFIPKGFKLLNC